MNKNNKKLKAIQYFCFSVICTISILVSPLFSSDLNLFSRVNDDLNSKINSFTETLKHRSERIELAFPKGKPFLPEGTSPEQEKNLIRVAAYDVGSTGVKFKIADVDPKTDQIVNNIYSTTKNTENLGFDINENNYMDRIAIMAGLKSIVEEYFPNFDNIKHVAVATAGFRKAGEKGITLAKLITEMTGIDFKIINQDDEGLLAYYGVRAKVKDFDPSKDIVWDVGGGSSQLVIGQGDELRFLGVEVGGNRFNELVRRAVKLYNDGQIKSNISPNPLTEEEVNSAIDLAKFLITTQEGSRGFSIKPFSPQEITLIKEKVAQGGKVYAIGAVHNFVAKLYADKMGGNPTYYTKIDIKKAIDAATGKSDEEIFQTLRNGKGNPSFVKADITSLILVYSMMDILGIDKIYPVDASNTDGLIIKTVIDEKASPVTEILNNEFIFDTNYY